MTLDEYIKVARNHVIGGGNLGPWFEERPEIGIKDKRSIINAIWCDNVVLDAVWKRKYTTSLDDIKKVINK